MVEAMITLGQTESDNITQMITSYLYVVAYYNLVNGTY